MVTFAAKYPSQLHRNRMDRLSCQFTKMEKATVVNLNMKIEKYTIRLFSCLKKTRNL
jgi:hypothetical protein